MTAYNILLERKDMLFQVDSLHLRKKVMQAGIEKWIQRRNLAFR